MKSNNSGLTGSLELADDVDYEPLVTSTRGLFIRPYSILIGRGISCAWPAL